MIIYRLRRHFFPSPFSLTLLWGGLAYIIVTSICTVFTAVSTADLQALPLVLVVSAILPFAILTAVLGMFIEKNPGPRSSLWLITTCAISMASFILMVFPTPGQSIRQSIILSILCCGPFLLVSALLAAFFITRAYPQFEASLFLDRAQRMRDILLARSEITLNNLSAELEMPLNSLPEFVDKLVKSGFVSACYSPETNYIYTLASLLEKQRRLTAIIQVRGRQTVGDLARDLHVPTSFIRKWLTNMAEKGLFIGYINPKTNEIISSQINSLAETPNCPNCGGLLTVVGKGVNQCAYCGAEIFLAQKATHNKMEGFSRNKEIPVYSKPTLAETNELKQSKWNLSGIWTVLRPQYFSRLQVGGVIFLLLIGTLCFISILATEPLEQGVPMALAAIGLFCLPLVTIILIIAALREKTDPPRFLLWCLAMSGIGISIVLVAIAMWVDQTAGPELSITSLVYLAGPLLSIFSIPVVYFAIRSWPAIIQELSSNLANKAAWLINYQGELNFSQIAEKLSIPVSQVDNLLDDLLRSGKVSGAMDTKYQRIYTTAALAEKQTSLLILVRDKGEIPMSDLAQKLNTPLEILQEWIFQLVQMDRFIGYINWEAQKLYAAHAFQLSESNLCPACGGKLTPGPEQTIHCHYCGTDIMPSAQNQENQ